MEAVLGLLIMLAGVTLALFPATLSTCNVMQNATCSLTLHGTIFIQLMTNASGYELTGKRHLPSGPTIIFTLKKNKIKKMGAAENRTQFFINNGTFKLSNAEQTDSGEYSFEVHDSNGKAVSTKKVKLEVKKQKTAIILSLISLGVLLLVLVMGAACCLCKKRKLLLPKEPASGADLNGCEVNLSECKE